LACYGPIVLFILFFCLLCITKLRSLDSAVLFVRLLWCVSEASHATGVIFSSTQTAHGYVVQSLAWCYVSLIKYCSGVKDALKDYAYKFRSLSHTKSLLSHSIWRRPTARKIEEKVVNSIKLWTFLSLCTVCAVENQQYTKIQ
jgi:hypothetical protein